MATIRVHGKGRDEAIIVVDDETGQVSYECSRGIWCPRQDEIRWEDGMDDAIEGASDHVDRHDRDEAGR